MPFAPEYVNCVLRENFDDAKALFLDSLLAVHRAHLVMLADRAIVSRGDARAIELVAAGMASAEFDASGLERRAGEGWITITELADTLVRDHGLSFGAAHGVARRIVEARIEDQAVPLSAVVAEATAGLPGGPVRCGEAALRASLSPRRFVEVRSTHGGPAPAETARALDASRSVLRDERAWLQAAREHLESAAAGLQRRSAAL